MLSRYSILIGRKSTNWSGQLQGLRLKCINSQRRHLQNSTRQRIRPQPSSVTLPPTQSSPGNNNSLPEPPTKLFPKVKFYLKHYWHIAIPIHLAASLAWFIGLYSTVKNGVDVVHVLESCHFPDFLVDEVKHLPKSTGHFFMALILYKILLPVRYIVSLLTIQCAIVTLRRFGVHKSVHGQQIVDSIRRRTLNNCKKPNGKYK